MRCPHCGRSIPDALHACPYCGRRTDGFSRRRAFSRIWRGFLTAAASILALGALVTGALYATGHLDDIRRAVQGPQQSTASSNYSTFSAMQSASGEAAAEDSGAITAADGTVRSEAPEGASTGAAEAFSKESAHEESFPEPPVPAPPDSDPEDSPAEVLTAEELESAVDDIRTRYGAVRDSILRSTCRIVYPRTGVTYYYVNGTLAAALLRKGVDDSPFARSYYFSGGKLFFCYYEAEDSYRLYIRSNKLIRLCYAADASDTTSAVDHDQETSEEYLEWQRLVVSEGRYLYLDSLTALEPEGSENSGYVLPESDSRFLTVDDLQGMSAAQCRLARNEIYARHGRLFEDASLQRYFNSCSWYHGEVAPEDFSDQVFNVYEVANSRLIVEYEKAHGYTK